VLQWKEMPLGKGQEQHMSPTQGQAYIIGATFAPAISQPQKGQLYGWLPLSDAAGIIHFMKPNNQTTTVQWRSERPTTK